MSTTTDRIEADVQASRHRLNDTLDELSTKLSPGQILDEAIGLVQGQAGGFATKLGRQVIENPMPSVLIAAGIAWLMSSSHSSAAPPPDTGFGNSQYGVLDEAHRSVIREESESESSYADRLHTAYAKALNLKQSAGEKAEDFRDRVSQKAEQIRNSASDISDRVTEAVRDQAASMKINVQQLYQDNPLVGGALSFAIGALIGAAAPLTEMERRNLGDIANEAVQAGANLVGQAAQTVTEPLTEKAEPLH